MTEVEWIFSANAKEMYFRCLRGRFGAHRRKVGRRKLRLFGCAVCRSFGDVLSDPRSIAAVEHAERLADGEPLYIETSVVLEAARLASSDADNRALSLRVRRDKVPAVCAAEAAFMVVADRPGDSVCGHWAMRTGGDPSTSNAHREWSEALAGLSRLLRDIFGNPFRPPAFAPGWRTSTAVAIAQGMYESRDFAPMPILADAPQDAGCNNEEVLAHCRGPGPHVRGCWVVDLVLDKA